MADVTPEPSGERRQDEVVGRSDINRGDLLNTSHGVWSRVSQVGHGNRQSHIWLDGHYYPLVLDGSSLATVRRIVPTSRGDADSTPLR